MTLAALRQWQYEERAATRQRIIDAGRQDTDPLWPLLRDLGGAAPGGSGSGSD